MKKNKTFTCGQCKETFEQVRSDEEAKKEFFDKYPECIEDDLIIICEECNIGFSKWFSSLSKNKRTLMRNLHRTQKKEKLK